mmetsp:Transcript_15054/g.25064  ORF Transcript_15054/g.25064 Transcript_15054/m.25064 type:complete len:379 (-) Transcript_15054:580-1716(-)
MRMTCEWFGSFLSQIGLLWLLLILLAVDIPCKTNADVSTAGSGSTRYFQTPMHEIAQTELYLSVNEYKEVIVTYAGRGTDLRPNDYLTHADGVRILSGGIDDFVKSGEREAVVPVVNDDDTQHGGSRLLGFMLLSNTSPRKLSSRRGEIEFDFEEGGPAPSMKVGNIVIGAAGAKTTSDPTYQPPPHGGGACLTGRDCFLHNGTCAAGGICACTAPYTGSYCQLYRPDTSAAASLAGIAAGIGGGGSGGGVQMMKTAPPSAPLHDQQQEQQQQLNQGASPSASTSGGGGGGGKSKPIKLSFGKSKKSTGEQDSSSSSSSSIIIIYDSALSSMYVLLFHQLPYYIELILTVRIRTRIRIVRIRIVRIRRSAPTTASIHI